MARRLSACHKYNEKQLLRVRISSAPACGTCSRGRLRWNLNCRFGIKQRFPPSPSPKPLSSSSSFSYPPPFPPIIVYFLCYMTAFFCVCTNSYANALRKKIGNTRNAAYKYVQTTHTRVHALTQFRKLMHIYIYDNTCIDIQQSDAK